MCVTLALQHSRVGAQDTILLPVTDGRVPQTCFVCSSVNNPQGHLCSISNINAPSTVESSLHCLVFSPETFLCSHTFHAVGDTSVLLPALPQSVLVVPVQDTLSVFGHDLISKPECVDRDQPTLHHSCTHLEPPLGWGHQESPALHSRQQNPCIAVSAV